MMCDGGVKPQVYVCGGDQAGVLGDSLQQRRSFELLLHGRHANL